ncbi:MAG TPA: ABC transporter transmembrane domain-containing protein, partial [Actinomycetota bacterium]|nr:ABC transporter transmembrane domain-containing protein [Actinomycetota bacterium]
MSSNALVRVSQFARPHTKGLVFSLVSGLAMMGAGLAIPPIIGWIFNELSAGRSDRIPLYVGLVLVTGALEAWFAYLRRYSAARASIAMEQDMRNSFYRHLQRLQVSFHDGWQSGQL